MEFEWDERKNASNYHKHGFSFRTAAEVFDDPRQITLPNRVFGHELRLLTIGNVAGLYIVVVIHTARGDQGSTIRIISARAASKRERRIYEKNETP